MICTYPFGYQWHTHPQLSPPNQNLIPVDSRQRSISRVFRSKENITETQSIPTNADWMMGSPNMTENLRSCLPVGCTIDLLLTAVLEVNVKNCSSVYSQSLNSFEKQAHLRSKRRELTHIGDWPSQKSSYSSSSLTEFNLATRLAFRSS